jgi:tetratricopeptide (TPR) repeat protein
MKQPPTEVTRAMRASRGTSCRVSGALPPASSRMTQRGFIIVFAVFVSVLSNSLALAQEARLAPDPVQTAETKAMREGRWADAEKILVDAIQGLEQTQPNSPKLAEYLTRLSLVLMQKQHYADAIAVSRRALEVDKNAFGPGDIHVASDLGWIAGMLGQQGQSDQAEQLFKQAVDIVRLNPNTDELTTDRKVLILSGLWYRYISQKRWVEAEPLILDGVNLCKSMRLPPPPCDSAQDNLSQVYEGEGRAAEADMQPHDQGLPSEVAQLNHTAQKHEKDGAYAQAEDAYKRAIAWVEKNPSNEFHDLLALELDLLGPVLQKQGLNEQAENAYIRAIEWKEDAAASKPPGSFGIQSFDFSGLLSLYRTEGRLRDMEPIIRHAIEIQEQFLGPRESHLVQTLLTLADVYQEDSIDAKQLAQAEALYARALDIQQEKLGHDHAELLPTLTSYVSLLRKVRKDSKAAENAVAHR